MTIDEYNNLMVGEIQHKIWIISEVAYWEKRLKASPSNLYFNLGDAIILHNLICRGGGAFALAEDDIISGACCRGCGTIVIVTFPNASRRGYRRTIVHELLHLKHKNWPEEKINNKTKKLLKNAPKLQPAPNINSLKSAILIKKLDLIA